MTTITAGIPVSRPKPISRPTPIAWLLAPALLLFVLFFVLPFGVMAAMSVFSANPVTNPNAFLTTRHYERFIFDSAAFITTRCGRRCASASSPRSYRC